MAELDALHQCTLGTSSFQLQDFKLREQPIVVGEGRVGSRITVDGSGYVLAASAVDFALAMSNAISSFRVSGQDFQIWGVGGVSLLQILAAQCVKGGPYVEFEMLEGIIGPALERTFRFRVLADTVSPGSGDSEDPVTESSVDTGPDDLRTISWSGALRGSGSQTPAAQFLDLLADFRQTYAWPGWVVQHRFEEVDGGDTARFVLTATELAGDLPSATGADGTIAVDGELVLRRVRDEQMRLTQVWDYDLLVKGADYQPLIDRARQDVLAIVGSTVPILSESVTVTQLGELRVRATFETLKGGNGNALMNWSQTLRLYAASDVYDEYTYPGAAPVLAEADRRVARLVQTGTAVGAGVYIKPPAPLGDVFVGVGPEVSYTVVNEVERQTSWNYVRAYDGAAPSPNGLNRPASPEVLA